MRATYYSETSADFHITNKMYPTIQNSSNYVKFGGEETFGYQEKKLN
jgi:hypothetical protein